MLCLLVFAEDDYDMAHARQVWRGYSVRLCHGSNKAQDIISDIMKQVWLGASCLVPVLIPLLVRWLLWA